VGPHAGEWEGCPSALAEALNTQALGQPPSLGWSWPIAALDAWRYSTVSIPQTQEQLPPSNASYCDSIGCGVRQHVGHLHLVVLPLAWSTRTQSIPLATLGLRFLRRQLHRKAWRCRSDCQLFLDRSLLRSPDTVALYAAPARRLRFDAWAQNRSHLHYSFFGADHHVFGSYGSLWAVSGLSGNSYVARGAETCSAGSLCDTCLSLILLLAEVEVWWSSNGASAGGNLRGRAQQEADFAQMLRQLVWHGRASRWESWGDWRRCLLRTLADLTTAWLAAHSSKELQEPAVLRLTAREQACATAGLQAASAVGAAEASRQAAAALEAALEGACAPASARVAVHLAPFWRAAASSELPAKFHPARSPQWRLCGPAGQVALRRLARGRLRASVLGLWGYADAGASGRSPGGAGSPWTVEVALFVSPADDCVYVDGQRLFQTHPQSYLAEWTCTFGEPRVQAVSTGVVSHSGTLVLLRCSFDVAPPPGPFRLDLRASHAALAGAGWVAEGIHVCPWRPSVWPEPKDASANPADPPLLSPQLLALRPKGLVFERGVTVCSEVLYSLSGTYRATLVQQWLEYHRLIGVDHFVIYDRDGELQKSGVLDPYLLSGFVTYFPYFSHWALSPQHGFVHARSGTPSHAAPDAQAAAHCLFSQRGLSEWVALIHSPDEYLSSSKGLRDVHTELLEPLRPLRAQGLAVVDVPAVYFSRGESPTVRPSPWLLGRYIHRASVPIELKRWGSTLAGFLNRFGSPLVDPHRVGDLVSAHYPRAEPGALYLDDVPQTFVRANHYGEAFKYRPVIEDWDTPVQDESILWAEKELQHLNLPELPPAPDPKPAKSTG